MSALERIAHFQNRRDEVPNQQLARELAAEQDRRGLREIAQNLWNKDKGIQADCIKVLYEVGYINPTLIEEYAEDFIKSLGSKNNRLVWGGMIALGTVADRTPEVVLEHLAEIKQAMDQGSVITMDNGVATLARAASTNAKCNKAVFPYLLNHLKTCRSKEVAQHCEKTLPAVNASNKAQFIAVLKKRMNGLIGAGLARVTKVVKEAEAR